MNLRDAKAQVEREQPELTGTAKLQAIKALREQAAVHEAADAKPTATDTAPTPATVREAWIFFLIVFVGVRLLGWVIWGSLNGEPVWYDLLYVGLFFVAVSGLVSAYRRRRRG